MKNLIYGPIVFGIVLLMGVLCTIGAVVTALWVRYGEWAISVLVSIF